MSAPEIEAGECGVCVYEGAVTHRRYKPKTHFLRYRVFSMLFDLDLLDLADKRLTLFSRNTFNLFSFYDRDHGNGKPSDLAAHIREELGKAGFTSIERIMLLCYPRILGYAFNPLSVYYCYDSAGALQVMLYEVRNTFGGRHAYLIPAGQEAAAIGVDQTAQKKFHVSPFIDMEMTYRFRLSPPLERINLSIETIDDESVVLNARFSGVRKTVTDDVLWRVFWRYPLMTVKVIAGIHWEALKLLAKGLRLRPGSPDPAAPVSYIHPSPHVLDGAK